MVCEKGSILFHFFEGEGLKGNTLAKRGVKIFVSFEKIAPPPTWQLTKTDSKGNGKNYGRIYTDYSQARLLSFNDYLSVKTSASLYSAYSHE